MAAGRTIAIGDIHGCISALDAVLSSLEPQPSDRIVVLGDFVDCGRESALVLDRLQRLAHETELICLLGNHEEMMLRALEDERAAQEWMACGGLATLNSYYFGADVEVIPEDHVGFLRSCLDFYETDSELFFHASYDPQLPAVDQPRKISRWRPMREPPGPHYSGKTVFVGHTEQADAEVRDWGHVVCIDTAAWRYGWLTAIDVQTRETWQASRFGVPRAVFS